MRIVLLLLAAFPIVVAVMAGIGGWLLPWLGLGEGLATALAGGLCGVLAAALWLGLARR